VQILTIKEVNLEIDEIVKRIDGVKKSIEDAFEIGTIDFDQITSDLETINDELQGKRIVSNLNLTQKHLLKAKESIEPNQIINTGDYR
jgi:hypothetical protein